MAQLFQIPVDRLFIDLRKRMLEEIDRIADAAIADADAEQLATEFMKRYRVDCPSLGDDCEIELPRPQSLSGETRAAITIRLPFSGDPKLLQYQGHTFPQIGNAVEIQGNTLAIKATVRLDRTEEAKSIAEETAKSIRGGLESLAKVMDSPNNDLKRWAFNRIGERQKNIASHRKLGDDFQKMGFRLKRRNDGTENVIIPVKPKELILHQPQQANAAVSMQDYDAILDVIRSMIRVFERSPSVFNIMGEEALRTILLVGLNGVFQGKATGETFNGIGDTDILIREGDTNIFIAECLIWHGPEHFRKKLSDQLFRYATWHDSKLAAIIFNRNEGFSEVVQKMRDVASTKRFFRL